MHAIELWQAAFAANEKLNRNIGKCEWLEATRQEPQAFLKFADLLERLRVRAAEATAAWVEVAKNMTADEVVAVIQAASK